MFQIQSPYIIIAYLMFRFVISGLCYVMVYIVNGHDYCSVFIGQHPLCVFCLWDVNEAISVAMRHLTSNAELCWWHRHKWNVRSKNNLHQLCQWNVVASETSNDQLNYGIGLTDMLALQCLPTKCFQLSFISLGTEMFQTLQTDHVWLHCRI